MKTIVFLIISSGLFLPSKIYAQYTYWGLGGGYNFPVAGVQIGDETDVFPGAGSPSASWTTKTLSFGKGSDMNAYIGYMLNKNFGTELNVSYLMGSNTTSSYTAIYTNHTSSTTFTYSANMFRFTPSIRLQVEKGYFAPYMVMGVIYGVSTSTAVKESGNTSPITDSAEYSGGYSLGFHSALGIKMSIAVRLSFYAELSFNYQNYNPTKADLFNGTVVANYVSSGTFNAAAQGSVVELPKVSLPFSSVGFNIGFHFDFADNTKPESAK